jgi:hypothetical protein
VAAATAGSALWEFCKEKARALMSCSGQALQPLSGSSSSGSNSGRAAAVMSMLHVVLHNVLLSARCQKLQQVHMFQSWCILQQSHVGWQSSAPAMQG